LHIVLKFGEYWIKIDEVEFSPCIFVVRRILSTLFEIALHFCILAALLNSTTIFDGIVVYIQVNNVLKSGEYWVKTDEVDSAGFLLVVS
jgi:hypothetical protein